MADDGEIIEAVLSGDTERYGELVERYQQTAWRVAYGLVGNFEDAKDLSQNGFVKAFQRLRGFRREARFSTWLYRIVANESKDFLRRRARRPATVALEQSWDPQSEDPILFEVPDPRGNPRETVSDRELAAMLSVGVEQLPIKQRTAFALRHFQGLSVEEIAQVMGCRQGTVKAHLFRANEHLRRMIGPFVKQEGDS